MTKLNRLIRLQKLNVEQQRLILQPLKNRIDKLEEEITHLHNLVQYEQTIAKESIEGAMAYGAFVKGVYNRTEQIQKFLKEANLKLNQEMQKLQDLVARQKIYEKIDHEEKVREKKKTEQQYQIDMDEKIFSHH